MLDMLVWRILPENKMASDTKDKMVLGRLNKTEKDRPAS